MDIFDKIFPPKEYTLANGKKVYEKKSKAIVIIPIILVLWILAIRVVDLKWLMFFNRLDKLWDILSRIFNPNLEYIPAVIGPIIETIKMSLLGSFLGAFVSLPFAYLAATNMNRNVIISSFIKLIFSILRTIPTLINALIATFIFGIGSVAGIIAIFIFSFSYVGKLTYEQIENADMGAYEALQSMGATNFVSFIKTIIPQILPTFLTTALYNFEGNIRYASILGYVGAGGVGVLIKHNIGFRSYENLGTILICVFVTVLIIENLSIYFRKKLS
ncbi:phosphonate ABC transporter, permease protein PhnE [Oceanivirga miroungae]|uniref:Binding-protein-dependent transport system inner membrane protein n=1 Tax=Oceanivirga miroungae TaxID=1130046 RepID=A0A6I8MFK5_9FUSO|nr:phosphonate ABC transporter, permease protein PhnE [Oceanivirga miroungae]VWL85921.1 binding-protein-dependent transport system inner membrane protein [Oceanivirga miroungae]